MHISNVHERVFATTALQLGALLDSLGGEQDGLWPRAYWPPLRLDRGLVVGAKGGHGPVHYSVVEYEPSRRVVFAFDPTSGLMKGVEGTHTFVVEGDDASNQVTLRHTIAVRASFRAWVRWHLVIRLLHNALIEDAFDGVQYRIDGNDVAPPRWGTVVRALRYFARRRPST
jgi:hypothetical protein